MGRGDAPGLLPAQIGRYEVLDELGAGGMGRVYLARHLDTGWKRAIKTLQLEEGVTPGMVERFIREAQAATQMRHENVVQFYEFGLDEAEGYYYIMEYLEGESLRSVINRRGRLPWDEVRELVLQIARGLGHAHQHGIIHRDIKPDNCVLVGKSPGATVKIIDFGIARMKHSQGAALTLTSAVIGTAPYLSPEQALQRPADERSDVYSVGALAYHLLTGETPFTGEGMEQVLAHIQTKPAPPRQRCPQANIPADAERIVLKCLAKQALVRYPSMAALEAALVATPAQDATKTRRWGLRRPDPQRRRRHVALFGGIGMFALAIGIGVLLSRPGDPTPVLEVGPLAAPMPGPSPRDGEAEARADDVVVAGVAMSPAPAVVEPPVVADVPLEPPPAPEAKNGGEEPAKKSPPRRPSCLGKDWRYVKDKIKVAAATEGVRLPASLKVSYSRLASGKVEGAVEGRLRGTAVEETVKRAFAGCEVTSREPATDAKILTF